MSSKYDKVEQLYRQLIPRLSRAAYWDKMLRQIAPFWKLANFTEGMLLTEQLPNATAVASFEQWKKMGRFVKFREKSVLIFASEFDTEVKYLFDISQTYGNAITPKWEMNERLANSIITNYNVDFGENVTNLQSVISKSLDKKLVSIYNYICKGIPSAATDSRVRQLIYDSAKVICMTRCGIDPSEIKADFSNIELLKKEISRIEIGNAGFELAKQVLREIDRMVRSEINERNNDENDVRGRHLRDSLHGEERSLLREDGQLRQEGHERTGSESPRYDGGAGQDGSSVHKHERAVSDDMGGNRSESGEQPQRNAGGAETENTVQPEHRDERAAADGDIHSGAELSMGYNQELRELADSGVPVEEHDSGAEYDNPLNDDGGITETETTEYEDEVDFSDGESASFLYGEQFSLFETEPPAAETSKEENNAALIEVIMGGTGFEGGKWRVDAFYKTENPSIDELAAFLKKEYGIGGSSSRTDNFRFSWYDAKGIKITMNTGEDVLFKWTTVAKAAAKLLANDEYITQKDKDDRLKSCVYHARYGIDHRDSYDIKVQEEAIGYLDSIGYDYCIGEENGTGYYLFPDSVCVVNLLRTNQADRYVICAPKCTLSDDYLSEHNITFLKIGRDVALKDMCYSSNDKLLKEIKAAMDAEPGHDVSFPTLKEQLIKRDFYYRELYEAIRNAEEVPLINTHEVEDKCYTIEDADSLRFENWKLVPDGTGFILRADNIGFGGTRVVDCFIQSFKDIDSTIDYLNSHELEIEIEIAEKENAVSAEQPAPSVPNNDSTDSKSIDKLMVGDVIEYGDETWRITDIDGDFMLCLENLGKFNNLAAESIVGNWKDKIIKGGGFKLISSAEPAEVPAETGHDVSFPEEEPAVEERPRPENFVIPDDFAYSHGKKAKYQDNIAAIKLLNLLETEKRFATPEEQLVLARYSGWGGIPEAFDKENDSWSSEYTELKNLLSETEYRNARASTNTAFYTDPLIIKSIYKGLEHFGFKSGRILDPSMGTGNFFGNMPEEMRNNSTLDGVELDTLTARIAHYLYPRASIQNKGFERARINTPYDVVVGNVPFGDFKPYDQQYDSQFLIHDYFFIKSLDNLKPGGIAALITSKGTLDKYQSQPRVEMLKRAELIGAVRLPNNAFESAGTETVTDILFFQKRDTVLSDEEVEDMDLDKDAPWVTAGGSLRVGDIWYQGNRYYEKHSDNILGEMKEITGRFGREITVMPVGDLQEQLDAAISRMSATFSAEPTIEEMDEGEIEEISIPDGVKPFTYYIENNRLYFADNRTAKQYSGDANSERAIKLMVEIVQRYDHIIISQRSGCSDEVFESERIALNNTYDMFVKKMRLSFLRG